MCVCVGGWVGGGVRGMGGGVVSLVAHRVHLLSGLVPSVLVNA